MAARQPHYSPKQVAEALRVSESSVKRWCDLGVVPTIRTIGGHRRVLLDGLQQFLAQTGRVLQRPEVLGLPSLPPARSWKLPGGGHPQQVGFRESLASGDEETCRRIMHSRLSDGWTRSEVAEDLITDAMHGVGEAWSCNQISVYQERRGCDICLRLIYELRAGLPPVHPDAPIAIGGTLEGDPYQLPTALVELALREVGWQATNLGSNLPIETLCQAAHDYDPQLVWLSVSTIENPAMFVASVNQLAEQLGEDIPLLVGGRALDDKIRPRLHYTAHCDSLRHLVELAAMMRINHRRTGKP